MKALHLNISLSDWITTFFAIHKLKRFMFGNFDIFTSLESK